LERPSKTNSGDGKRKEKEKKEGEKGSVQGAATREKRLYSKRGPSYRGSSRAKIGCQEECEEEIYSQNHGGKKGGG